MKKATLTILITLLLSVLCICLLACDDEEDDIEEDDIPPIITINFDSDGGTLVESQTFRSGATLIHEPQAPSKYGYKFSGWYNGNTQWDFNQNIPTSDLTLRAVWTPNSNLVSTNTNMESAGTYTEYSHEATDFASLVTLEALPYVGYSFTGWFNGDTMVSNKQTFSFTMPNNNITYTAKFEINSEMLGFEFYSNEENCVITKVKNKSISEVDIPNYVTKIGFEAFYGCTRIKTITIPNSVIEIGEDAFSECLSLETLTLSNNLKIIGTSAFSNCRKLANLTIPDSVTEISMYAFRECDSLTSITIGSGVTEIHPYAFAYCDKLIEVINKSNLDITTTTFRSYGSYVLEVHSDESKIINKEGYLFYTANGANYLIDYVGNKTELNLPDEYNGQNYEIRRYAFFNNDNITKVIIPEKVSSIGENSFANCNNLKNISIHDKIINIGNDAFVNTAYYDNDENWQNDVLYIGNHLIEAKMKYGTFTIKDGTLCIAENAFLNYNTLISITIPNSITSICNAAFANSCTGVRIKYRGTQEQWNAITKGYDWNYGIDDNFITYNYTGQ